jgi:hypothetical protein
VEVGSAGGFGCCGTEVERRRDVGGGEGIGGRELLGAEHSAEGECGDGSVPGDAKFLLGDRARGCVSRGGSPGEYEHGLF